MEQDCANPLRFSDGDEKSHRRTTSAEDRRITLFLNPSTEVGPCGATFFCNNRIGFVFIVGLLWLRSLKIPLFCGLREQTARDEVCRATCPWFLKHIVHIAEYTAIRARGYVASLRARIVLKKVSNSENTEQPIWSKNEAMNSKLCGL